MSFVPSSDHLAARMPAPPPMGGRTGSGLGSIELLAVIAVVAVLLGLVVPSLRDTLLRSRTQASAHDLLRVLATARVQALLRGGPVTVCATADPGASRPACTRSGSDWSAGWIAIAGDGNADLPPLWRGGGRSALAVRATAPVGWRVTFNAIGQPVGSFAGGSFHLCPTGRPELGRAVVLSRAGRARLASATCSG